MDELQDTNGQQARLLDWCGRPTGSTRWAISTNRSSASATPSREGFANSATRSSAAAGGWWSWSTNFRSRPEILSAVETIMDGARGSRPRRLMAGREFDAAAAACAWSHRGARGGRGAAHGSAVGGAPDRELLEAGREFLQGHCRAGAQHRSDRRVHGGLRPGRHPLPGEPRPGFLRNARGERPGPPAARHRQSAR